MYEVTIPETQAAREKRGKALSRKQFALNLFSFLLAILAIGLLVAFVVLAFVYEFGGRNLLFVILGGSFAGGAVAVALLAFLLTRAGRRAELRYADYAERCDGETSFFVGEGTLATFGETALTLHAEKKDPILVPYPETRFFSVCLRKRPQERGEWAVLMEIPAKYLKKKASGEPPALIQIDAKPRLYRVLSERGLDLLGEIPPIMSEKNRKFRAKRSFYVPDPEKRKGLRFPLIAGAVMALAGIPVLFFQTSVGILLIVFGVFFFARSLWSYLHARSVFGIYEEGIFWRDREGVFLKWEEISSLRADGEEGLTVVCAYGDYRFPLPAGAKQALERERPALWEEDV